MLEDCNLTPEQRIALEQDFVKFPAAALTTDVQEGWLKYRQSTRCMLVE